LHPVQVTSNPTHAAVTSTIQSRNKVLLSSDVFVSLVC
jgi:hypothetical protein